MNVNKAQADRIFVITLSVLESEVYTLIAEVQRMGPTADYPRMRELATKIEESVKDWM